MSIIGLSIGDTLKSEFGAAGVGAIVSDAKLKQDQKGKA